ncbi:MAG: hypothetical protein M0P66_18805 [Salinivirgaceae bacterium]|nr:hypothetical protein [Salinivirgaceae bacterium]
MEAGTISYRVIQMICKKAEQKGLKIYADKEALNFENLYELLPGFLNKRVDGKPVVSILTISPVKIDDNGMLIKTSVVKYQHKEELSGKYIVDNTAESVELIDALGMMLLQVLDMDGDLITQDRIKDLQMDYHYGPRD